MINNKKISKICLAVAFLWVIMSMAPLSKAQDVWMSNLSPVERFIKFVTDVPPIEMMVCSMEAPNFGKATYLMWYRPSKRPYQGTESSRVPTLSSKFRIKPAAFFCKEIISPEEVNLPWDVIRQAVGAWEDDYWFLETRTGTKTLHLYHYEPDDWSNALAGWSSYFKIFGEFTSFGLSLSGPGCVILKGGRQLEVVYNEKHYPVTLELNDGIPVKSRFKQPAVGPNRTFIDVDVTISYSYDTNIAPIGIPIKFTHFPGRATNRIYKMKSLQNN